MASMYFMFSRVFWSLSLCVLFGCTTSEYRFIDSVKNSAADPMVWANAGVGVILSTGNLDQRLSDSARKHHYVFGSEQSALDASDTYRAATRLSMDVSALAVSADYDANAWGIVGNKGVRLLTDNMNAGIVAMTTARLKKMTKAGRPNGECCGFPSGHASRAFATANLTQRNYQASALPVWVQNTMMTATYTSAYLTAWGRVESGQHYPSQVFLGAAYGVFLSSLIHDVTEQYGVPFSVGVSLSSDSVAVHMATHF